MASYSFTAETATCVANARRNTVGDLLRRSALRYPDKLAVVDKDQRYTFSQFNNLANRAASSLARRGLAKGDRLALLGHNSWQYGVLAFATAKIGVILVPINFMLGPDEITFILDHSEASGMVVEDELAPTAQRAMDSAGLSVGVRGWIGESGTPPPGWEDVGRWFDNPDGGNEPDVSIADDEPLRLMYTSGTEARPKAVMLTSRSLIAQYASCAIDGEMSIDDIEVHALPMYHCAQLDCFFSVDIYLGATSIILPHPDPAMLLAAIEEERVTKLFCPPTVWISLLNHPDFDTRDLSSLRKGYYGASAMPVEVLSEVRRRLPDVRLWNFYGQTEMAPLATILRPHEQEAHAGSAGRTSVNVETRIVDEYDEVVPFGETGEIVHRSPHATIGYYHDEEKTAAAFRNGWFHSGDLGIMSAHGYLSVVDRKKDMIKTGGENVASRDVEEALYGLDGVAEVAVFGVSHPRWIEAVVAAVVPREDVPLTTGGIMTHARDHLAGYKCPKYVVLVDTLPKSPSGKVLKRELRQQYASLADGGRPT